MWRVISPYMGLALSESITIVGLLLDLGGVALLSLTGIFGDRPFRRYYCLLKTDRSELNEGHATSGAFGLASPRIEFVPEHKDDYDEAKQIAKRQSLGISFLLLGFGLQIVGAAM